MSRYRHFLPVNDEGYYGRFGGAYIPEILHANVENLREAFYRLSIIKITQHTRHQSIEDADF